MPAAKIRFAFCLAAVSFASAAFCSDAAAAKDKKAHAPKSKPFPLSASADLGPIKFSSLAIPGAFGLAGRASNLAKSPLIEAHAIIYGLDAKGAEVIHSRAQWNGRAAAGSETTLTALEASLPMARKPPVIASTRVVPVFARLADGSTYGAPAPWSSNLAELASICSFFDGPLDEDRKKSNSSAAQSPAQAKTKTKTKTNTSQDLDAATLFWAKPKTNPYEPAELFIAFALRNASKNALEARAAKATFYQAKDRKAFFTLKTSAPARIGPGEKYCSLASFGSDFFNKQERADFESSAKGHGVDVERAYKPREGTTPKP